MVPFLNRVALPLYQMVKSNHFVWTVAASQAWGDLLFLVSLHLKNYIFQPARPLFLLAYTSAIETSTFIAQWNSQTLNLNIVSAKSNLLTTALRHQSPIHREAYGVSCVLSQARPYLLTSTAPASYLFTDASSISYIGRVKFFNNFLMDLSLEISQYPSLNVIHTPGRVLFLPDIYSRQLDNAILPRSDTNLSKNQADILPNLSSIPPGQLIDNDLLRSALHATPPQEFFDVE
jgi:hypothetical protein